MRCKIANGRNGDTTPVATELVAGGLEDAHDQNGRVNDGTLTESAVG